MSKHEISRRHFLGKASCAAIGSVTLFSGLFNLKASGLLASNAHRMNFRPENDYRALVCILLAGGNDSFNMLVPSDNSSFNTYQETRSNMSLNQNDLLSLSAGSGSFGVHPSMPEVQQLFNQNKLAFLANVGTLVDPISDRAQFESGMGRLPLGLFSHADQIMQWQTSVPNSRSANGWGGRLADLLMASNSSSDISMNISLAGNNMFQVGNQVVPYAITPFGQGSTGMLGYEEPGTLSQIRSAAVNNLLEQQYQDIFKQTYADVIRNGQESHELFSSAVANIGLSTIFSPSYLSQSLSMVARTIAARNALGMNRQTFFITLDGFDNHDELLNAHSALMTDLSKGLGEFDAAMEELGLSNDVTTFTISDFARTLTSNGNGTDHGWGGNVIVTGGAVKGGKIYGQYPSLEVNQNLDVGGGVLIPTMSTDEYFAELALWLGVAKSDLPLVLPNLGNFYDLQNTDAPIGFLL